jgi:hypothetical protein
MSRETISLAQGQVRHDREIAAASRAVGVLVRNAPQPALRMFELTVDPAAVGVLVQEANWIRNNDEVGQVTSAPVWDDIGVQPASGNFDVWAEIDDLKAPTTLSFLYKEHIGGGLLASPPVADNRWLFIGEFNITGGVVAITAQHHTGLKQDWDYS